MSIFEIKCWICNSSNFFFPVRPDLLVHTRCTPTHQSWHHVAHQLQTHGNQKPCVWSLCLQEEQARRCVHFPVRVSGVTSFGGTVVTSGDLRWNPEWIWFVFLFVVVNWIGLDYFGIVEEIKWTLYQVDWSLTLGHTHIHQYYFACFIWHTYWKLN